MTKIMPDVQPQKIEVPHSVKSSANESQIFSMPEKFRGLAAKISPPAMKPAALPPQPVLVPKPIPPSRPGGRGQSVLVGKGLSKTNRALLIAGAVLLVVVGGSGLYVYFAFKPVATQPVNKSNVSATANRPADQTNINSSTNTSSNQSANQQTTTPVSPFPNNSQPGRDTDSDGLTDVEEILYKTSSKKPDTDSDGFLDGNEVFHGYDPNAPAPALLNETSFIKVYEKAGVYDLPYPSVWTVREAAADSVLFVVPSGETISVSLESKTAGTTLADWFSGTNPSSEITVAAGLTKKGYGTLVTEDQMTVYVEAGSRVIILSYQNTVKATVDYLATFEMMTNGLSLVE